MRSYSSFCSEIEGRHQLDHPGLARESPVNTAPVSGTAGGGGGEGQGGGELGTGGDGAGGVGGPGGRRAESTIENLNIIQV